ncbi:MAG TPA: penicillin-binding transpeptidase domain-containing protein [Fibrobacteria bacterium]|nr:penicillin-binding transpeptidase domain-containing protein [Fibrobacteria bacterium]
MSPSAKYLPWERPPVPGPPKHGRTALLSSIALTVALAVAGIATLARCGGSEVAAPVPVELRDCRPKVDSPGKLPFVAKVDPRFQAFARDLLRRHPTELTIVVGLDLRTARPLFIASRRSEDPVGSDLMLATSPKYPMASLAKILTSAAALESGIPPEHELVFRGKPHTLYKSQVRAPANGTEVTLAKAFAFSINPIFGQLGASKLGEGTILRWADSLGFNRSQGLGNGVPAGVMAKPSDTFNLAELSSGFIRTTFISPVHAAMIVRKFGHDGILRPPAWDAPRIDSTCEATVFPESPLYTGLSSLFSLTVDSGTARGGFSKAWPLESREGFEIGGKTGSLDGTDPEGHYEWFAGYARMEGEPDSGIAIAVMTVNAGKHVLNASWTAATLLHYWSRHADEFARPPVPATAVSDSDMTAFTEADQDALADRPWHRPWKKKKRSGHRKRH